MPEKVPKKVFLLIKVPKKALEKALLAVQNLYDRGCSSFKSGIGTEQGRTPRFEAGRNKIVLLGRYQLPSHRKTQHNSYPRYHFIYEDIISFTGV